MRLPGFRFFVKRIQISRMKLSNTYPRELSFGGVDVSTKVLCVLRGRNEHSKEKRENEIEN